MASSAIPAASLVILSMLTNWPCNRDVCSTLRSSRARCTVGACDCQIFSHTLSTCCYSDSAAVCLHDCRKSSRRRSSSSSRYGFSQQAPSNSSSHCAAVLPCAYFTDDCMQHYVKLCCIGIACMLRVCSGHLWSMPVVGANSPAGAFAGLMEK